MALRLHVLLPQGGEGQPVNSTITVEVQSFSTVLGVKQALEEKVRVPVAQQRLLHRMRELHNNDVLDDTIPSGSRLTLQLKQSLRGQQAEFGLVPFECAARFPSHLRSIVQQVSAACHAEMRVSQCGTVAWGVADFAHATARCCRLAFTCTLPHRLSWAWPVESPLSSLGMAKVQRIF